MKKSVEESVVEESMQTTAKQTDEIAKPVYKATRLLTHDERYYQQGDVVADISKAQADVLISLGVLVES